MDRSTVGGAVLVGAAALALAYLLNRRKGDGNAPGTPPMLPVPPGFGGGSGTYPTPRPPISALIPPKRYPPGPPQPPGPPRLLGGGIR